MDSAGAPRCQAAIIPDQAAIHAVPQSRAQHQDDQPPRYMIDLSLPPLQRYQHVARDFKPHLATLPTLFDEVVGGLHPNISIRTLRRLASIFLRRLYGKEETQEIRGICNVTGLDMHLLIAFNTFLDLFMGCTSGGARVKDRGEDAKMLHFRTLDWGMDPLRKIIVQLDYVNEAGGEPIATSITYVGFVGCLTGVRNALSISLNFRPNHIASSRAGNLRFYLHQILVLLGFRPSISAVLREYLIPSSTTKDGKTSENSPQDLAAIEASLPGRPSTAAYLIFSDGDRTVTMEKDNCTAVVKSSPEFIVATNHDVSAEKSNPQARANLEPTPSQTLRSTGMDELVEESTTRKRCIMQLHQGAAKRAKKSNKARGGGKAKPVAVTTHELFTAVDGYPITNKETHYSVVMDPKAGKVVRIRRFLEPTDVL
ncbi:Acid ceramidase, N-terminal [Lasallia pustulata]|uniref:ceramidase n=1 Tax=Lasallia pustulata TaxID=136370 RepID=A0A1W5DEZ0_9LECA|nr:Acid ceramidase, N-terminal [Lasallia pustulata]